MRLPLPARIILALLAPALFVYLFLLVMGPVKITSQVEYYFVSKTLPWVVFGICLAMIVSILSERLRPGLIIVGVFSFIGICYAFVASPFP